MNEEKKYQQAFDHIFKHAIPDQEAIDRMGKEEVEAFLADSGVDIEAYRQRVAERKQHFAGKYALLQARRERLRQTEREQPEIEVPETKEGILQKLSAILNAPNPARVYGRNFEDIGYDELRQLYIDTVKEDPGKYGDDPESKRDQGGKPGV